MIRNRNKKVAKLTGETEQAVDTVREVEGTNRDVARDAVRSQSVQKSRSSTDTDYLGNSGAEGLSG